MNKFRKILTNIALFFRSWVIIKKTEVKQSNNTPSIIPGVETESLKVNKEQEAPWNFQQKALWEVFAGDPPIVYSSDLTTIKKQDQYGYTGKDATKIEDEGWYPLQDGETMGKILKANAYYSKTADFQTEKEKFEERWNRIKEEVENKEHGDMTRYEE